MIKQKSLVQFHFLNPISVVQNRTRLKAFIRQLFKNEKVLLESLTYVFCSDAYLHRLNKEYLNHDNYTDIITFPLSKQNSPVVSDIYISAERVKENAAILNTTFKKEIHRIIFHGALHLCGYLDKTKADKNLMRKKENTYLEEYFVPRETI